MINIFISYNRRNIDSEVFIKKLASNLSRDGFFEITNIEYVMKEPNLDKDIDKDLYFSYVSEKIQYSEYIIIFIDPYWIEEIRRLETTYLELVLCLKKNRSIKIIPVLIEGASMPSRIELPPDLHILTHYRTYSLNEFPRGKSDVAFTSFLLDIISNYTNVELKDKAKSVLSPLGGKKQFPIDKGIIDIFISYAREDEERVKPLAEVFNYKGWSVFWDRRIPAGRTWRNYIGRALEQARCVIVIWSKHSIESDFVIAEAEEGKERNVLIPVLFDPVRPPLGFRGIQAADLSEWKPPNPSYMLDNFLNDLDATLTQESS